MLAKTRVNLKELAKVGKILDISSLDPSIPTLATHPIKAGPEVVDAHGEKRNKCPVYI